MEFSDFSLETTLIPQVITKGYAVDARIMQRGCNPGVNTGTSSGIFAIGNNKIQSMILSEFTDRFHDEIPSGSAYNVSEKGNFHFFALVKFSFLGFF
jgi:hypothetical protein